MHNMIRSYYSIIFNQHSFHPDPGTLEIPHLITVHEVKNATKRLKHSRATGIDNVPGEFLKYGGEMVHELLAHYLNDYVHKNQFCQEIHSGILVAINKPNKPRTVENTRAITVLTASRKTLSLIALQRALPQLITFISPSQSAFIQDRSTADILWTLRWAKAVTDKRGHPIYVYQMDIAKAFDSLDRHRLLGILWDYQLVDLSTFSIIRYLLTHTCLFTKVNGEISEDTFTTMSGIPQGDALSPVLFDVYLEAAARYAKAIPHSIFNMSFGIDMVMDTEYADDFDIIAFTRQSAELATKKQAESAFLANGLHINEEKSRMYALGRTLGNYRTAMDHKKIKKLGSMVDSVEDYELRVTKAKRAFGVYSKLFYNKFASLALKLKIFNACVKPFLLYNASASALPEGMFMKINGIYRQMLRKLRGVHYPFIISNHPISQKIPN